MPGANTLPNVEKNGFNLSMGLRAGSIGIDHELGKPQDSNFNLIMQ